MEPGNLAVLSAFRQDRADRLLEQMQRRAYGCAAPALRRGGGAKNFLAGRVSRSGGLRTRLYTTSSRTRLVHSSHGIHLRQRPPSSYAVWRYTVRHLHAAKPYTPRRRKAYDEPLIQTALYSLCTLIHPAYSNT